MESSKLLRTISFFLFANLLFASECRDLILRLVKQDPQAVYTEEKDELNSKIIPSIPWHHLSKMDSSHLKDRKLLVDRNIDQKEAQAQGYPGFGWLQLETATLNGRKVFIKTTQAMVKKDGSLESDFDMRSLHDFEKEVFWTKFVGERGWGPKFEGVTETDGHPSIITEYVEGIHIQKRKDIPPNLVVLPHTLEKLQNFRKFIEENHISILDFQIRLKPDGDFVVVDTEYNTFIESGRNPGLDQVDNLIRLLRERISH